MRTFFLGFPADGASNAAHFFAMIIVASSGASITFSAENPAARRSSSSWAMVSGISKCTKRSAGIADFFVFPGRSGAEGFPHPHSRPCSRPRGRYHPFSGCGIFSGTALPWVLGKSGAGSRVGEDSSSLLDSLISHSQ